MSTSGMLLLAAALLLIYEGVKLIAASGQHTDAAATGTGGGVAGSGTRTTGLVTGGPGPSGSGGVLSPLDLARGLQQAGMPLEAIPNMVAILLAENGGRIQGTSAAGAQGFAQFLPATFAGVGGNPADLNNPDPGAIGRVFAGIVRLWQQQGYTPWDPWRYVAGPGPYGEQYVGPGNGSYRQFLPQAQQAVVQLGAPGTPQAPPGKVISAPAPASASCEQLRSQITALTSGAGGAVDIATLRALQAQLDAMGCP